MKQIYGLIGYPLIHSFSKSYFNEKFEMEKINAEYINFEIPRIEELKRIIDTNPGLAGMNVTIPYKEKVIAYMDEMDETAARIGAVNVIKFIRSKGRLTLKGYNSDVVGFTDSISPLLTPERNKALVLGTGGAAKAVFCGLESLKIEPTYVSRTAMPGRLTYAELTPDIMDTHKIIINTTPVGMYPHEDNCPDIPYHLMNSQHLCYDLIYNPDETLFMKKAKQYGAEAMNGLEMLLLQAFAAWNIWNE